MQSNALAVCHVHQNFLHANWSGAVVNNNCPQSILHSLSSVLFHGEPAAFIGGLVKTRLDLSNQVMHHPFWSGDFFQLQYFWADIRPMCRLHIVGHPVCSCTPAHFTLYYIS